MRKILPVILLMSASQILLAYEPGMLNLVTPTGLRAWHGEVRIQHRFYGKASEKPFDTFFGMDLGANVGIGIRYSFWPIIEVKASRFRNYKEGILGVSFSPMAYYLPTFPLRSQIDVEYFSYEEFSLETNGEERKSGVFALLSLQSEPIFRRLTPAVDMGYNGQNGEFGAGLGLAVVAIEYLGIIQKISVIGEYFPTTGEGYDKKSLAFGVRIETFGHHFDLILHNNSEMGVKRLMAGSSMDEGLRFGFNIKRLIGD